MNSIYLLMTFDCVDLERAVTFMTYLTSAVSNMTNENFNLE